MSVSGKGHSSIGDPFAAEAGVASYASRSNCTLGRKYEENRVNDGYRTPFQHDRDRIIYSTAFRRLQYKTQVYVVHEGDFYRTRLTHSLEVMQHAQTLARALGANEDLVEAISYAHDLGHPPFGHAGEETLNELMEEQGFEHNFQSLRIVDELEMRYHSFPGLNLCYETREGLARHSTTHDDPRLPDEFSERQQPALETQISDVADELAYCTHDLDDALTAGLIDKQQVLDSHIDVVQQGAEIASRELKDMKPRGRLQAEKMWIRRLVRHMIEIFSVDVIKTTRQRIKQHNIMTLDDVVSRDCRLVGMSEKCQQSFAQLGDWLYETVYRHPRVLRQVRKGKMILKKLFQAFEEEPRMLHPLTWEKYQQCEGDHQTQRRVICDHLAGMTDRYAMDLYESLFEPYEKVLY